MTDLKSCFCASYPRLRADDNGRYWFVKCDHCDRASIHSRTQEEAVDAWNIGGPWS